MELRELSLANNQLTVFPAPIIDMNKLRKLNMSKNQLSYLTEEVKTSVLEKF